MSYPNVLEDIQEIQSNFNNYLPLRGGIAFRGNLPLADGVNYFMRKLNNEEFITFYGGSDWGYGGGLFLRGQDNTSNRAFELWSCKNKANLKKLEADFDGNLYWSGNLRLTQSVAFLGSDTNTKEVQLCSGSNINNGSGLLLYGSSHSSYPGCFNLYSILKDGTRKMFIGSEEGILSWGSERVVSLVESYVSGTTYCRRYSDGWIEQGGYIGTGGTFTFRKPFSNNNYHLTATGVTTSSYNAQYRQIMPTTKTASYVVSTLASGVGLWIYACGY